MIYNIKIKKFANNRQQIILYDYPIHKNDKITQLLADKAQFTKSINQNKKEDIQTDSKKHSILNSKNRTIKMIYDLARANNWDYFVTLTFNPQKVNRYNYDDCVNAMRNYIKTLKKYCPQFQYLIVPELHSDKRAWHMHGLIKNIDGSLLIDSNKRTENGEIIYNIINWYYGWNECTKVISNDKVVRYITKYITKELCEETLYRNRYY